MNELKPLHIPINLFLISLFLIVFTFRRMGKKFTHLIIVTAKENSLQPIGWFCVGLEDMVKET